MNMITGPLFQTMVVEGALAIAEKKEQANELNVFPVPDGDTGTNMSLTMASAMEEMNRLHEPTLAQAADKTASALLRGARGNSGVILSLLFRGMAKKLRDLPEAGGRDFAVALREGVDTAYKAVMKPAEGTILTVSRVAAQKAVELCQADPTLSVEEVFRAVLERGETALAETTGQNPVLAKAGVVDAGGFGFLTILSGMFDAFQGIRRERAPEAETASTRAAADFSAIKDEDITFTYCTEFIAERRDKSRNVNRMRSILGQIGDSLVVVEDDDIIKVHVHTDQPNRALEEALKFGPLLTVKIENMREQHTAKVIEADAPRERVIAAPEKKFGFVAVAAGEGLQNVFTDLGVDQMVRGGQTMNPSTDDLLHAIDAVPAEVVFVLPNNKNIIMAAEQAVPLSEKQVVVLPTKNIPQGMTAMLAFDGSAETEANKEAMTEAIAGVRAGQVTYAARNSDFDGKKIKEGEYLALCEGRLTANSKRQHEVIKKLAREMVKDESAFATIIFGEGVTAEEAEKVEEIFRKENRDLEITVIDGGQPVYYYLISVE